MSNILFVYGLRSPKRRRLFNHKLNNIKKFDLLAFIRNLFLLYFCRSYPRYWYQRSHANGIYLRNSAC